MKLILVYYFKIISYKNERQSKHFKNNNILNIKNYLG